MLYQLDPFWSDRILDEDWSRMVKNRWVIISHDETRLVMINNRHENGW